MGIEMAEFDVKMIVQWWTAVLVATSFPCICRNKQSDTRVKSYGRAKSGKIMGLFCQNFFVLEKVARISLIKRARNGAKIKTKAPYSRIRRVQRFRTEPKSLKIFENRGVFKGFTGFTETSKWESKWPNLT